MSRPLLDLRLDVMSAKPHSHSLELWNKGIRIAKQCVCFWLSCVPENLFPHTNFRVLLETSTVPERSQQNRALCHKYSKWLILKINKEPLKTWWTWVWVNSGSCWWTGRPGVLWFMGSQGVRHNWATELNWTKSELEILHLQGCKASTTIPYSPSWITALRNSTKLL